jgi:hypothetical protein
VAQGTSRVWIGTADGFSLRPVVRTRATTLDVFVLLDGTAATITAATCTLARGNQQVAATLLTTLPATDGIVAASVSTSNLDTFGLSSAGSLFDTLDVSWTVTITDGASSIVVDFPEIVWIAESLIRPSIQLTDVTGLYPDFTNGACDLTTAQIVYHVEMAWRELWNWLANEGPSRLPWNVRNSQVLRALHLNWTHIRLAAYMDAKLSGSPIWGSRVTYHTKEVERLKASLAIYFKVADPQTKGDEAPTVRQTARSQRDFGGRATGKRGGL